MKASKHLEWALNVMAFSGICAVLITGFLLGFFFKNFM
jgi:hypothetical protein